MKTKRSGLANTLKIIISVVVISIVLIFILGKLSEVITDYANRYYMSYYTEEVPGFSSPWYINGLHRVDESFLLNLKATDENTVYAIGSSFTSNDINDETVDLNGYVFKKLVCGNGSHRSNRILYNLGEKSGIYKDKDIIKYEVSYSTFRNVEKTITESILDKWGKYSVDENLEIKKSIPSPLYAINVQLIKIQNVWELMTSWWEQNNHPDRYPAPKGYANFKNNYFNYDAVADSCYFCDEYKEHVLEDIDNINKNHIEIVELSPIPEGLLQTEFGQNVNSFIEEELIPYLKNNGIRYRDLRFDYSDGDFCDGVHLSYSATIDYTKKLNEYINNVIDEIE